VRKIPSILAGTTLAGALLCGAALAPAAQAATTEASATTVAQAPFRHFFGPYYSGYGRSEGRSRRSYVKGYWTRDGRNYRFVFTGFDRDRDRQYTYYWVRWHDRSGTHRRVYRDRDVFRFSRVFRRGSGFNDFDVRVCEGTRRSDDCGRYHDVF
jgi:hypothetical protein